MKSFLTKKNFAEYNVIIAIICSFEASYPGKRFSIGTFQFSFSTRAFSFFAFSEAT